MRLTYRATRDTPMTEDERALITRAIDAFESEAPEQPVITWRSTGSALFAGAVDIDMHRRTSQEDMAFNVRSILGDVRDILPGSLWQLAIDDQPLDWNEPLTSVAAEGTDGPTFLRTDEEISRPSTGGGMMALIGFAVMVVGFILAMVMAGSFWDTDLAALVGLGLLAMAVGALLLIAGVVATLVGATADGLRSHRKRLR